MDVESQEWTKLLDRCLLARVKGPKFSAFCKALYSKNPIASSKLANIFIRPRASSALTVDPLIPSYIECLLALEQISVPDALRTLLRYSRLYHSDEALYPRGDQSEDINNLYHGPDLEQILLFRYAKCFITGGRPKNAHEAYSTLRAVATWMSAIVTASTKDEMMQDLAGVGNSTQPEAIAVREAVGMLVVALAENGRVMSVLDGQCPKDVKQTFAHALSLFIPFLSQTSLQIANRLASFQKQYNIYGNDASKAIGDSMMGGIDVNGLGQLQGVDGVLDGHFVNSRAGLYIYFSAVVCVE
ncbi:MAG: mediator complex subunit [Candelina submexicana]|nr:MAG: mediator complex subunit [Candelina submexicana]